MKNTFRLLLGGLFLLVLVSFDANDKVSSFTTQIISRFNKIWATAPQEKVYLQTDKPYYNAGEDLWFKGYLLNATTHQPTTLSRYLYVELTDKADSVIKRVKIRKDSLGFAGNIRLNPGLSPGYYTLRAFTYWMQNAGPDFFFRKNIYIGNSLADGVSCQIIYGTPVDGNIPVNLNFSNTFQSPMNGKSVFVKEGGSRSFRKKYTFTLNPEGKIKLQLTPDSTDHARKWLDVTMSEGELKYNNRFFLPDFSKDFDVQFFPESGVLTEDNLQVVAFKAIGTDGLSVEVTGKIFSDKDKEITEFSTANKGMGKFILHPEPGETFYALVKTADGREKRFNLPLPNVKGVALHLVCYGGKIIYEVVNKSDRPAHSLYLLVHSRGKVNVMFPVGKLSGQIAESALPAGINSFAVIDSAGNTLCERQFFDWVLNRPEIRMESNKATYGTREAVELNLNVRSLLGNYVGGNFSISVTDSRTVLKDSLADNILSYLLLSSDLKGYIEEPAAYFRGNPISAREKMDILMLTQGWRRFETADVVKGKLPRPVYYLEEGQALSGKVTNVFGKPSKKSDIIMLSGYKNMSRTTQTDSLGRYLIEGIEFPDSTSFILKAKKKNSVADVEIIPDSDFFVKSNPVFPVRLTGQIPAPSAYFQQSKDRYYFEGGMKGVNLDEITVVAGKTKNSAQNPYYAGIEDSKLSSKELERFSGMNILTALSLVPGVQVMGDKVSIRGNTGNPQFFIDGFSTDRIEDISYLSASDVEEISVFKGASAAIFGSRGGNGVIAITLKRGADKNTKAFTPPSLVHIFPLGYQKPVQFYVPKYEVDSVRRKPVPDLRTTIYWNPNLRSDSTGTIRARFYTADQANDYTVELEGVTDAGEICRYVGILKREDK